VFCLYDSAGQELHDHVRRQLQMFIRDGSIPAASRLSVAQALRYLLRAGTKPGENWQKELEKAENYIHRARTGRWIGR